MTLAAMVAFEVLAPLEECSGPSGVSSSWFAWSEIAAEASLALSLTLTLNLPSLAAMCRLNLLRPPGLLPAAAAAAAAFKADQGPVLAMDGDSMA